METKFLKRFKIILLGGILLSFCGFDGGCEPIQAPPPPNFRISSESIGDQTKFYFTSNENVVIEKIEVKGSSQFTETINFGYPSLMCNVNEKHTINCYPNQYGCMTFYFSGISRDTRNAFYSVRNN